MKRFWLSLLTGSMLISALASCGPSPTSQDTAESGAAMEAPLADTNANLPTGETVAQQPTESNSLPSSPVTAGRPQLIKRANLSLRVESVENGFEQVRAIVTAQQGDLLSLNDAGDNQRTITAELRVPSERLDATLVGVSSFSPCVSSFSSCLSGHVSRGHAGQSGKRWSDSSAHSGTCQSHQICVEIL